MTPVPHPTALPVSPPAVTQLLATFVASHPSRGWSDAIEQEAHRTFLNWLGCAIGASTHAAVDAALASVREFEPSAQATVLGRNERVDMGSAALLNGISSHLFDFDDTHWKTLIHPAGPVASAALALAEKTHASGRELVDALVLGIDVACRVGIGLYPGHYDQGWHITGSTGALGAAAACARLLKLDAKRCAMALGLAASQPIGVREQFGTMAKSFHPGAAARAGLNAAVMARHGYTASAKVLEAPRGYLQVLTPTPNWQQMIEGLGTHFEISANTYKPFACGVVIHPAIDGCVQLFEGGLKPDDIARVELRVHPLVLELTGKSAPSDGLEGKFSIYHGCAVGLALGAGGEAEFSDEIVRRSDIVALRNKVTATVDNTVREAAAGITVHCKDGRRLQVFVEHAIGSRERPLSDQRLAAKFDAQVTPILGADRSTRLIELCRAMADQPSVQDLCRASAPALPAMVSRAASVAA